MKDRDEITKKSLSDSEKQALDIEIGQEESDIYTEEGMEDAMDNDEISPDEEGFMRGASDDGQNAKCANCGNQTDEENTIEKEIDGKKLFFCCDRCANKYSKKHK